MSLIMRNVSFALRDRGACWLTMLDDVDLVQGMPVCVQIVGGRFGEEKAVSVAKVVDELVNAKQQALNGTMR